MQNTNRWRHDTKRNGIEPNDTQRNEIQHNDTQHNHIKCIMLNVFMLSVVMQSVKVPKKGGIQNTLFSSLFKNGLNKLEFFKTFQCLKL